MQHPLTNPENLCPEPGKRLAAQSEITSQDEAHAEADRRLTELEIKASFAEDLLEELNQVIVRQQQQIDALLRETRQLRQLLPDTNAASMAAGRAGDDLPPHY